MTQPRQWWPARWADEIMPPGRPTPDAFIVACAGPKWRLGYAADATDVMPEDLAFYSQPIAERDIVEFYCCDDLGEAEIAFDGKGGFRVVSGSVPAEPYNWCRVQYDQATMCVSLRELAATITEHISAEQLAEPLTVAFAQMSDEIPHQLVMTAAGPIFSQLAVAGRA